MIFSHQHFHKCILGSPDRKIDNQIDHILIVRRWHSSILDVRSVREGGVHTDHYLVVAKVKETLAVGKQAAQNFDVKRFNIRQLSELEVRKQYHIKISNRFADLENLNYSEDIHSASENIKENIKTSAQESLGLNELKQH